MSGKRDLYLLAEAYEQVFKKKEKNLDYDDVINVDGEPFYVRADYEADYKSDPGDGRYTPSTNWVEVKIDERDIEFYKENPDTGDFDIPIDPIQEKELFEKIFDALYEKIKDLKS